MTDRQRQTLTEDRRQRRKEVRQRQTDTQRGETDRENSNWSAKSFCIYET